MRPAALAAVAPRPPGRALSPSPRAELAPLRVLDLADALLLGAVRSSATALLVEARGAEHAVTLEEGAAVVTVATLPAAIGDAVVARLALLARLDIASGEEQVGRLMVLCDGRQRALLVALRVTAAGLSAEVRRVASAHDRPAVAVPAATDIVTDLERAGYRIHGEIGRGGMGIVYRGEHVVLGRPVAIKVLRADLAADDGFAARFVREARAASRTRHPGIVDVTDFGTLPGGEAFLVMELVAGVTLAAIIAQGPLEPSRAVAIARQIALALGAAHAAGVVHRDLKPANVFVGDGDALKLGDFGEAKLIEAHDPRSTGAGTICGTPCYMSPEHARGLAVDGRTDLYALGCVLFEMITGKVPFDAPAPVDVMLRHIKEPVPPVTSPFGPVPQILERTIRRAMAKLPEHRHQSADELLDDLDRCLAALARPGWRRWLPT